MELIKKVCNDNKLELEDMRDFITSLEEFLKKFDDNITLDKLSAQLEISKKLTGLFGRGKREYLQSVIEFLGCFDQKMFLAELQAHCISALEYLNTEKAVS
jgi:hypothetical protein